MTFSDRLRLFAKAAIGLFDNSSTTTAFNMLAGILPGSHGEPPARGTREYLQGYSSMPWLRAVAGKIAWMTATPAWTLSVPTTRAGQPRRMPDVQRADFTSRQKMLKELKQVGELREITNHPLLDLLNRPNGYLTGFSMRKLWQIYLDLVGENFSIKERNGLHGITELWPVPPHWVLETPTPTHRFYRMGERAWQVEIPDTEVLWMSDHDPVHPYSRGSGTAESLADELEIDFYSARHLKSWFYNSAQPPVVITMEGARAEELDRAERAWLQRTRGVLRAYLPHFVSNKIEIKELSQTFQNMQLKELRAFERDTIVQVFGLNPEMLGILQDSNRASIQSAEFFAQKHVVTPRLEFQRLELQERLVPEFDERLILGYVSPIEEDWEYHLKVVQTAPWAFSVDEIRDMAGQEPLRDKMAGALHAIPFQISFGPIEEPEPIVVPRLPGAPALGGNGQRPALGNGNGTGEAEEDEEVEEGKQLRGQRRLVTHGRWTKAAQDPAYAILLRLAGRLEPRLRNAFVRGLQAVRASIDLDTLAASLANGQVQPALDAVPWDAIEQAVGATTPLIRQAVISGADLSAATLGEQLGQAVTFDLNTSTRARQWLQMHSAELVTNVTDESKRAVRSILESGYEAGRPVTEMAREIRAVVGLTQRQAMSVDRFRGSLTDAGVTEAQVDRRVAAYANAQLRARGLNIARTEIMMGLNRGTQAVWDEAADQGLIDRQVARKVWLTAEDDAVDTEVCEPMPYMDENQEVPIDGQFTTGTGEHIDGPPAHPS